jgi:protease I
MANKTLQGCKVAILVTDGFEYVELVEPRKALDQEGAETNVVSPKQDRVRAWNFTDWGTSFRWICRWIAPRRTTSMRCCSRAA